MEQGPFFVAPPGVRVALCSLWSQALPGADAAGRSLGRGNFMLAMGEVSA
jgi:hypothetical protein